jgi:hypothetical protein
VAEPSSTIALYLFPAASSINFQYFLFYLHLIKPSSPTSLPLNFNNTKIPTTLSEAFFNPGYQFDEENEAH